MSEVNDIIVKDAHGYTRSETPWILGEHLSPYGKLFHYLSGGGMQTFGRTVHQEEVRRRHNRCFILAGALVLGWTILYLI